MNDLPREVQRRQKYEEYEHFVNPREARWEAHDTHSLRSWRQQSVGHGQSTRVASQSRGRDNRYVGLSTKRSFIVATVATGASVAN